MGLLEETRVPISLIPERLIAEAASERGFDLSAFEVAAALDGVPQVELDAGVLKVLDEAVARLVGMLTIWVRLGFTMEKQEQTNWCWAAAAVSLARYYTPWSTWRQCELVNQELGQTTCCVNGASPQCNQGNNFETPFKRTGVYGRTVNDSVDQGAIMEEISRGRPLGVNIQWAGGGGHYYVIYGYSKLVLGDPWIAITDPWFGESDLAITTLDSGAFLGSGRWDQTYFTRKPALMLPIPKEKVLIPGPIWERVQAAHLATAAGGTG